GPPASALYVSVISPAPSQAATSPLKRGLPILPVPLLTASPLAPVASPASAGLAQAISLGRCSATPMSCAPRRVGRIRKLSPALVPVRPDTSITSPSGAGSVSGQDWPSLSRVSCQSLPS